MANIQERKTKDGKTHFRVQVRLKGYPVQSATFRRKTDALKWVQQTEAAIREGRHFKTAEAKKRTFGELVDRYIDQVLPNKPKSYAKQKAQLLWWKKEIGPYFLSEVTPPLIGELKDKLLNETTRRGKNRSNSTVIRYLACLSHAFTIAVREWGWVDDSPLRKVSKPKEPRGRVRFLEVEERERLLQACRESSNRLLYPIVKIAIATGMRRSEILNLTWGDVDFQRRCIVLHETKNGERRVVSLSKHALELLVELKAQCPHPSIFVFPGQKGQNPQKPVDIRTAWESALSKAEISNFTFHDLRHCCASYLAMNGASLAEIAEVLGHKTLQMVKRYAHLSEAHTAGVVASMNEKIFG